jgi:hypothetical protein
MEIFSLAEEACVFGNLALGPGVKQNDMRTVEHIMMKNCITNMQYPGQY